jgi:hypothetical protein
MQGKRPFNKLFSFLSLFFACLRQFIRRVYWTLHFGLPE